MTARAPALWLALLLGGCIERVDLGLPVPGDAGVEDQGPDATPPDALPPDELPPDEGPPPECATLDHPACDAREDCDWYGAAEGYCGPAGPCDTPTEHRACVTDADCDWNGEADGFCEPTHDDPSGCSDLYFLSCHETPGCSWEGTDWGECFGEPVPPDCGGLEEPVCLERPHCRWYGDAPGFCDDAVPCWGLPYESCISSSSCDWGGGPDGFCRPTETEPGGCEELLSEPPCFDVGCLWDGDPGECRGDPAPPPACEGLVELDCRDSGLCDWYGTFCDPAGVCDELESHAACILRSACDWEGEADGNCRPTVTAPTACTPLGFHACRLEDVCAWEGGDYGECFEP